MNSANSKNTVVQHWLDEITASKKREKDFREDGQKILRIYCGKEGKPFNILFSNTETLLPALYSNTPRPKVEPTRSIKKTLPNDPRLAAKIGAASMLANTLLEYLIDTNRSDRETFSDAMEAATLDALLPGRGVTTIEFDADIFESTTNGDTYENDTTKADTESNPEGYTSNATEDQSETNDYAEKETISVNSNTWNKVILGFATKWSDVPWIAYEQYMGKTECIKLFGKKIASELKYSKNDGDQQSNDDEGYGNDAGGYGEMKDGFSDMKTAHVFQIWDKSTKKILYISPCYMIGYLKEEEDPYGLTGFFNCPRPLQFLKKNDIVPVPLYKMYENQAEELNRITGRLNKIFQAIKVVGFFNGNLDSDLENLLQKPDLTLTASSQSALLVDGGLEKNIWLWPIDKLINVANMLILARNQAKQTIYEITGISDILRANTNPSETLGAQKIKEAWGTLRIKRAQAEVARYARDTLRIMLEMAITKMSMETIQKITQLPLETEQSHAQAKKSMEMVRSNSAKIQLMAQTGQIDQNAVAQAMQQAQQQMQQANAILSTPTWEETIVLLKDDMQRAWNIDIETNSTIDIEATEDKKDIAEIMNSLAQFMNGISPMMEAGMMDFETAKAMLSTVAKKLRFGTEIEDRLASMQPPQPKDDGKAEAQAMKEKAEVEKKIMAQQQQSAQAVAQAEEANRKISAENEKLKFELQAINKQRELDKREMEIAKREIKVDFRDMVISHKIEIQNERAAHGGNAPVSEEIADQPAPDFSEQISPLIEGIVSSLDDLSQKFEELSKDIAAPTELIRGKDGKVTQVKKGKRTAKITRDENGKMALIG